MSIVPHGPLCSCDICRLNARLPPLPDYDSLPAFLATEHFDLATDTTHTPPEPNIMMVYACSCRQESIHTSIGVPACSRCSICGSKFSPLGIPIVGDPEPHTYVIKYDENTGIPYRACTKCYEREDGL
jgi:hypothetical protein